MSSRTLSLLLGAGLLTLSGAAHSATYVLQNITFQTISSPSIFTLGEGSLSSSECITCGVSTLTVDGNDITATSTGYRLAGFGADFTHTFAGTGSISASVFQKSADNCVAHNANVHYCDPADPRSWMGNWYDGLRSDGVTASPAALFDVIVDGNTATMSVRKARDASDGSAWLQLNFNYTVVPVPAAAWLFGGALGVLGLARRRRNAA